MKAKLLAVAKGAGITYSIAIGLFIPMAIISEYAMTLFMSSMVILTFFAAPLFVTVYYLYRKNWFPLVGAIVVYPITLIVLVGILEGFDK